MLHSRKNCLTLAFYYFNILFVDEYYQEKGKAEVIQRRKAIGAADMQLASYRFRAYPMQVRTVIFFLQIVLYIKMSVSTADY